MARANGLTAQSLSTFKGYFQSGNCLLEEGFGELRCKTNFLKHEGACKFDIAELDGIKHSSKQ